ncbi:MAG: O-antigen ligase C-terminal domain-containing protein [Comamonadaceae bacterium]|nr:O-antigen ligase C-terminal domain-containing protein [Comamonadaceae bacterium]
MLDLLAWNGIPLGIGLIGLGAYWFFTRAYKATGINACYAMGCLLPFTIHSLVEFPFAYAYFLVLAGFMMGAVEGSSPGAKVLQLRRTTAVVVLVFWLAGGVYLIYEYFLIEEDVRITRFENLRVGATALDYEKPNILLLSQMAALQRASRQQPVPGMSDIQIDDMRQTVQRFPHGGLVLRYALILALNRDEKGAREMLKIVRGMYGESFYVAVKDVWNEKSQTYPVLKSIVPPE